MPSNDTLVSARRFVAPVVAAVVGIVAGVAAWCLLLAWWCARLFVLQQFECGGSPLHVRSLDCLHVCLVA